MKLVRFSFVIAFVSSFVACSGGGSPEEDTAAVENDLSRSKARVCLPDAVTKGTAYPLGFEFTIGRKAARLTPSGGAPIELHLAATGATGKLKDWDRFVGTDGAVPITVLQRDLADGREMIEVEHSGLTEGYTCGAAGRPDGGHAHPDGGHPHADGGHGSRTHRDGGAHARGND